MSMRLATGQDTDQGRRSKNEDAFLIDDERALFAVADGMGGHRGGEVASRTAIEALRAAMRGGAPIKSAIARANDAVLERAAGNDELTGMGTTLTADHRRRREPCADRPRGRLAGVPAARRRDAVRVTDDHSLVEELVREGRLTPEQAESHPRRAIVTRALGVDPDVEVDLYTIERRGRRPHPALLRRAHHDGARARHRAPRVRSEPDPQRAAELLVDAANRAGGEDNITVVVIDVLEVDPAAPRRPDVLAPPAEPDRPATMQPCAGSRRLPGEPRCRRDRAVVRPARLGCAPPVRAVDPGARARVRRRRLVRAPLVLRRLREQSRRDLQGCAGRRARLGPDDREAHEAHRCAAPASRPRPR